MQVTLLHTPASILGGFSGFALDARGREWVFSLKADGTPFFAGRNSASHPNHYDLVEMPRSLARAVRAAIRKAMH